MDNQASKIAPKMHVEFKPEQHPSWAEDIWGIRIYVDGQAAEWVHWIETGKRPFKIVRSRGIQSGDGTVTPCGWGGSESQAISGSKQIQKLWDDGEIT